MLRSVLDHPHPRRPPLTPTFTASTLTSTDAEAKPLGQPTAEPLDGSITTRARTLTEDLDGRIKTGTWECEVGTSRWEFVDRGEFVQVFPIYRP